MALQVKENLVKALEDAKFKPEIAEIKREYYDYTGYPTPVCKYALSLQSENYSIEEIYFWLVGHAMEVFSMPYIHKITDIMAASQGSSMFGDMGQRVTAMQNQASNLLATVNNMTKDLFKKVRDFRKLRERLSYYKKSEYEEDKENRKKDTAYAAENTLKDLWITLVEGGGENPSSVYGMARKVNFVILPDLFFQAPPLKENEIPKYVKDLDFNQAVKVALERKLYQFYHWKKTTKEELKFKETMMKKSIYQHYQNIRVYFNWIKPYLKNSNQLTNNDELMSAYGIISSFQTSLAEIEVLLQKPIKKAGKEVVNTVILMHFLFQTSPELSFHAKDSYHQKGPSHVGRADVNIRAYVWTNEEIEKYKKLKTDEDIELLTAIDYSLKNNVDEFGSDLKEIINEIELEIGVKLSGTQPKPKTEKTLDELKKEDAEKIKKFRKEMGAPFSDVFKGFKELFWESIVDSRSKEQKTEDETKEEIAELKKDNEKTARNIAWNVYKNYKKSHKMTTW